MRPQERGTIDMKYVDFNGHSSMILDAAYDMKTSQLFLGYESGNYRYKGVKPHVFRNIVNTYENGDSIGRLIHKTVDLYDGEYIGSGDLETAVKGYVN